MDIFNHNIRFLRKKLDLSQQKFADKLGEKRGRIAAYEDKAKAPDDFKRKLAEIFDVDLGRFITVKMTDINYQSFMTTENVVDNIRLSRDNKSDVMNILMKLKGEEDNQIRSRLVDEAVLIVSDMMKKENVLRSEINQLQKDLLEFAREAKKI